MVSTKALAITSLFATGWWCTCRMVFGLQPVMEIPLTGYLVVFGIYFGISLILAIGFQKDTNALADNVSRKTSLMDCMFVVGLAIFLSAAPWIIRQVFGLQDMQVGNNDLIEAVIYRISSTTPFFSGAIAAWAFHKIVFELNDVDEAITAE